MRQTCSYIKTGGKFEVEELVRQEISAAWCSRGLKSRLAAAFGRLTSSSVSVFG